MTSLENLMADIEIQQASIGEVTSNEVDAAPKALAVATIEGGQVEPREAAYIVSVALHGRRGGHGFARHPGSY